MFACEIKNKTFVRNVQYLSDNLNRGLYQNLRSVKMQVPTQQLLCSERVEPRADYRLHHEIHFKNKYFMGFGSVFFQ